MTVFGPCPNCNAVNIKIEITHRRSYGRYRRLLCNACHYIWTHREVAPGSRKPIPPPRQQCPNCESLNTAAIESRQTSYGRRRRYSCKDCQHRWTKTTDTKLKSRNKKKRDGEQVTNDEIWIVLTSGRTSQQVALDLRLPRKTIEAVRAGEIHADRLPEIPRWTKQRPRLSCLDCRFWDHESMRPCQLGWPDPEIDGYGYADECSDYAARKSV